MPIPTKRIADPTKQMPQPVKSVPRDLPIPKPSRAEDLFKKLKRQEAARKEPPAVQVEPPVKPAPPQIRPRRHEPEIVYTEDPDRYFKFEPREKDFRESIKEIGDLEEIFEEHDSVYDESSMEFEKATERTFAVAQEQDRQTADRERRESTIVYPKVTQRNGKFPFLNAAGIVIGLIALTFGIFNAGGFYETSSRLSGDLAVFFYVWQIGNLLQIVGAITIYHNGLKLKDYIVARRNRKPEDD